MAEGMTRSKSKDCLIDLSLKSEFESHKQDMQDTVKELKNITEETISHKVRVRFGVAVGATAGSAVVGTFVGLFLAPFTGGLSMVLAAASATLVAGGAVAGVRLYEIKCDRETVGKVTELIIKYKWILERLKDILEKVRKACRNVRKYTEDLAKIQTQIEEFVTVSEDFMREYSVGHLQDLNSKSKETLEKIILIIFK